MLQLRFVPVSQGMWVFVPVFIWIRADLSTCTKALLNHGLNFHTGHFLNPVENTHEAAANPSAQQHQNFSKNSVWCSFCVFYHLKLSLPQLYHCQQLTDSQRFISGTSVRAVRAKGCSGQVCLTPQAFRELQECSCQRCYLGHPGLSESRGEAVLAWAVLGTTVPAGCSWGSRDCSGHCELASRAQRAGEPQSWVDAWHTSLSHVFILLGCS